MADHEELWENSVNVEVKTEKEIEDTDQKCCIKFDPIVVLEKLDLSLLKLGKVGDFLVPEEDKQNTRVKWTPRLSFTSLKQNVKSSQNLHIDSFDGHICSSKLSPKWTCQQCGEVFTLKERLKRHVKNKHDTDNLIVVKLEDVSREPSGVTANDLSTSIADNHASNFHYHETSDCSSKFSPQWICQQCGAIFMLNKSLKRHVKNKHATGNLIIVKPEGISSEPSDVTANDLSTPLANNNVDNFHCHETSDCSATFSPEWICQQCGAIFMLNRSLKRHVKNKHATGNLIVVKPEDISSEPSAVTTNDVSTVLENDSANNFCHLETSDSKNDRLHRCVVCGKSFNEKSHLGSHLKRHVEKAPHKCNKCCLTFTMRKNLQSHMRRKHPCADENADSDNVVIRQSEKNAVVPDEPVSDDHIGSVSPADAHSESSLSKMNVSEPSAVAASEISTSLADNHGGNFHCHETSDCSSKLSPNWMCQQCGAVFMLNTSLKRHVKNKHATDNLIENDCVNNFHHHETSDNKNDSLPRCDVCGKTFSLKSHLRSHLNLHVETARHKCNICCLTFTLRKNLKSHMRRKHPCADKNVDGNNVVIRQFEKNAVVSVEPVSDNHIGSVSAGNGLLPDVHDKQPVTQLMSPLSHWSQFQANYNEDTAQIGNVMYFVIKEEPAQKAFDNSSTLLVGIMAGHCVGSDETVSAEPVTVNTATLDMPQHSLIMDTQSQPAMSAHDSIRERLRRKIQLRKLSAEPKHQ